MLPRLRESSLCARSKTQLPHLLTRPSALGTRTRHASHLATLAAKCSIFTRC
ncbi:hypothetical protein GGH98_005674, partial [Coemansia sp. RSA 454]